MIRTRNGFMVQVTIAVVAGRVVNEPMWLTYQTRKEAARAVQDQERVNAEALQWVAEVRAARLAEVASYLERRAARSGAQLSLGL